MEKFNIDRKKVRTLLARAPEEKHRTEKHLADQLGVKYPTYWRRCKNSAWKREQIIALTHCLAEISGDAICTIEEITTTQKES